MAYVRKTHDEYELQGNYGYGWDIITIEATMKDAHIMLKSYNANEPYPHRIVKKRVRNNERSVSLGMDQHGRTTA